MSFISKIHSLKSFWYLIRIKEKFKFFRKKKLYQLKDVYNNEQYKVASTVIYFTTTFKYLFKTILFVAGMFTIEHYANQIWASSNSTFPYWFYQFIEKIPKPIYPDVKDSVLYLVSVIASVSGVILALFYPLLATIASTTYAKTHSSLRNLLLYNREIQGFLRKLTYLTTCSIGILLLMSFNYAPGNLVLTVLALLSFLAIFGILKIGIGIYNFFEPSTLSSSLIKDIFDTITNVTIKGTYWDDRNFQHHNYKKANQQIENLSLTLRLCLQNTDIVDSSFISSFKNTLILLQQYSYNKHKIPTNSKWFPEIHNHSSYFESGDTSRNISKTHFMYVQPKIIQNHLWFEQKIIQNTYGLIGQLIKTGNLKTFKYILLESQRVLNRLCTTLDFASCQQIIDELTLNFKSLNFSDDTKNLNYNQWKDELEITTIYFQTLSNFQLTFLQRINEFNSSKITSEYNKIKWDKTETLLTTDFIPEVYKTLIQFQSFIKNERQIEKKRVTPDWYFIQKLSSELLNVTSSKLMDIIHLTNDHQLMMSKYFMEAKNPLLTSLSSHLGLETINKLRYQIRAATINSDEIDSLEKCKGEFNWNKPNFTLIDETINTHEKKYLDFISSNINTLSKVKWDSKFPDIFAQSYSLLSTHINWCFENDNQELFKKYFPEFLRSAILAFNNINETYTHFINPKAISYQTLIDLMEISGYAKLYSYIYKTNQYWDTVKECWDKSFIPTPDNIKTLTKIYNYYKSELHGVGINYNEKHIRNRTFLDTVKKLNIKPQQSTEWTTKQFISDTRTSFHYEVSELFIETYLFTFVDARNSIEIFPRRFFHQWCAKTQS